MQIKKVAVIALLCALAFASAASVANAINIVSINTVWTTSTNDMFAPQTHDFSPGQTIYIWWIIPDSVTPFQLVFINVLDAQNNPVAQSPYLIQPALYNQPIELFGGLPTGNYIVSMTTTGIGDVQLGSVTVGVWPVFVLPESIFGAISALGAGFAAFGLVSYVKLKKQKKPKQ